MPLTTKKYNSGNISVWLVYDGNKIVGILEKYKGKNHPIKAYSGEGRQRKFIGSFYGLSAPQGATPYPDPMAAALESLMKHPS